MMKGTKKLADSSFETTASRQYRIGMIIREKGAEIFIIPSSETTSRTVAEVVHDNCAPRIRSPLRQERRTQVKIPGFVVVHVFVKNTRALQDFKERFMNS